MPDLYLSEKPHYFIEMAAETVGNIYNEVNHQVYKSKGSTNKNQGRDSKALQRNQLVETFGY